MKDPPGDGGVAAVRAAGLAGGRLRDIRPG